MIIISISKQTLIHRRKSGVCYAYVVSTASKGPGNQEGSWQTPLGKHRIGEKIGANLPLNTAFKARQATHLYQEGVDDPNGDWILTRILWLEGCETSKNKRGKTDSKKRYIYIHGTHEEDQLGKPASHGCIRMANDDILELFEHVQRHEKVYIRQ